MTTHTRGMKRGAHSAECIDRLASGNQRTAQRAACSYHCWLVSRGVDAPSFCRTPRKSTTTNTQLTKLMKPLHSELCGLTCFRKFEPLALCSCLPICGKFGSISTKPVNHGCNRDAPLNLSGHPDRETQKQTPKKPPARCVCPYGWEPVTQPNERKETTQPKPTPS